MKQKPLSPAMLRAGNAGSGSRTCLITGCIVVVILGILVLALGIAGYMFFQRTVTGLVDEWTDTQPIEFPPVEMAENERGELQARFDAFTSALKEGTATLPLTLTEREANILLSNAPDDPNMPKLGGVAFEDGRIRGEVSIPLEWLPIGDIVKGRYLNGSAVMAVSVVNGRLQIYVDNIEVNGRILPEEYMEPLRQADFAEQLKKDPEMVALFRNLEEIRVEDGQMVLVPKGSKV